MKKLMILMAAVATSAFALGADSLKNVFDATTASNLTGWHVPEGDGKAVLDKDNGVLTLATGSDAASYWVQDKSTPYAMGDNLYFDVSLDLLGQALDEVPTLPSDAKLALFLLDTTDIDGAPAGTNLYALAKHPTEAATVLMKLNADVETLTRAGTFTRLTVQTYKNVFKSEQPANSAFVVYQNGGATEGTVSPVQLDCYYTFKNDGSVNWNSPESVDGSYLSGVLDATVSGKRTCLLLSVKSGVDGQSFKALDFTGNAKIKKVEINASGFGFIAADETVTTITLEGVSITVDPPSAYDATKGTLSDNCTITVTKNEGMEVLKYTPMGNSYLVDNKNGTFTYKYAEGNDVSFTAVPACATVNGQAYETIEDAIAALGTLTEAGQSGTLKLSRDIGASDLRDGFLTIGGTVTLDLAGKKISAPADTVDFNGTVSCEGGILTIIDSATGGYIESVGEGGVAVCSLENSKISIKSGIFKGRIRDAILEAADEAAQGSEEEPVEGGTTTEEGASEEVAASITITGGSFLVKPDNRLIAEDYVATYENGYWTVAKGGSPAVGPVTPGTSTAYDSEEAATAAADAINANKGQYINLPEGAESIDKAAYTSLFTATARGVTVTVALTAEATTTIQAQVDAEVKKVNVAAIAAATGESQSQAITTTPGLFYSVVAGDTLTGMAVKSCTLATGPSTTVTLPKFTGKGFYKLQATVTPVTPVGQ